jgi:hypothetical protein
MCYPGGGRCGQDAMMRHQVLREGGRVTISDRAATRVLELLRRCDARTARQNLPLFQRACAVLRERDGIDFEDLGWRRLEDVCVSGTVPVESSTALAIVSATLEVMRSSPESAPISADAFELRINEIFSDEGIAYRLRDGSWRTSATTEAEVLRRLLLRGDDDVAGCRQGDQQVEMVVSTIQSRLASPGAVLVDYGAGLGRVLAGLAEAERFRTSLYVAVDEPIPESIKALARTTGASTRFLGRREYMAKPVEADVTMVVNTLHHMPFRDAPKQLATLVRALKPGGAVLVHEMGMLREPEQRNVPWKVEDLYALFAGPTFSLNARSTVTRSGVPLAHVLVQRGEDLDLEQVLTANIRRVWAGMKTRTLEEIADLYEAHDEARELELQHALIVNANLDLNQPTVAG